MGKQGAPQPSNREIVDAMRLFAQTPVELGFWGEVELPKSDQKAKLVNQPVWSKAITWIFGILAFVLFNLLVPRHGDPPEPLKSNLGLFG